MKVKNIFILSLFAHNFYGDISESKKSLKNNIMSSVAKNPEPLINSNPKIDLTAPKINNSIQKSVIAEQPIATKPATPLIIQKDKPQDHDQIVTTHAPDTQKNITPSEPEKVDIDTKNSTLEKNEKVRIKEPDVLYQPQSYIDDQPATIVFNFEEANLSNLLSYMESVHNIKFITDDIISTMKDAKGIAGHKITFRTNRTLTRKESWDICVNFLHIAGLDIVPLMQQGFYRLISLTKANNEPIPTYIGVDSNILPDNDMIVRYVYFLRNITPDKIQPILTKMQSGSAKLDPYAELKGLIFTDRASSIKSLIQIVTQLDQSALPEVLSVVKLKRANAEDVKSLYESLKPVGNAGPTSKVWATKKETSMEYFPQDVVIVPDKRTNSLILLGTTKDVARIEEFITKHIDVAIERDAPPIFTYKLQYTNAKDLAGTLTTIVGYGGSTDAGKYGGVRDGLKYFQKMTIVPDSWSNSLIINSTQEDFDNLKPLIEELDVPQKQVGLEVLFVQVHDVDLKTLGAQISGPNGAGSEVTGASPFGPTFLQNVSAQTSGIARGTNIVVTRGANAGTTQQDFSIKSSLASLLGSNVLNEAGSLLVTFGAPIWAIFKVLKSISSTHVVSNPFLVVSNNSTASIVNGQEQRQTSGVVVSSSAVRATGLVPIQATLTVTVTPQINNDNIINLSINVQNEQFVTTSINNENGNPRTLQQVITQASVANGETLVLGGIMSENYASAANGVPFLENIPVLGWFFKNKTRNLTRDHFLIFICPRILDPVNNQEHVDDYTNYKLREAQDNLDIIDESDWFSSSKDPIHNAFFGSKESTRALQEFRTGTEFADRQSIDGKINPKKITPRKKRQDRDKDRKLKKVVSNRQNKTKEKKSQSKKITTLTSTQSTQRTNFSLTKDKISQGVANVS